MSDNIDAHETENKAEQSLEPVWCVVANVVDERQCGPYGWEKRRGTKHFVPGAKVYLCSFFKGAVRKEVTVIGRHRGSSRYVTITMSSRWLTNWRPDLIYQPFILSKLRECSERSGYRRWDGSAESKEEAARIAAIYQRQPQRATSHNANPNLALRSPDGKYLWGIVAEVSEPAGSSDDAARDDVIRNFAPGTRSYVLQFPNMEVEQVEIAARHRDTLQYMTAVVASRWLTNWRVERIDSPYVLARLRGEEGNVSPSLP